MAHHRHYHWSGKTISHKIGFKTLIDAFNIEIVKHEIGRTVGRQHDFQRMIIEHHINIAIAGDIQLFDLFDDGGANVISW